MYLWDLVFTSEFVIQCLHFAVFSFAFSLNVFSNAACQHLNIRYTSVSIIGVPLQDCIQLSRANTYSWCTFCLCSFFRSTICVYINCDCFRFSVENVSRTTRKWFFLQLYNYPTGGQLFVFILMIDIFCLGASLVIICWVFAFQLFHIKRKGAVNPLHAAQVPNMLTYPYIYDILYS